MELTTNNVKFAYIASLEIKLHKITILSANKFADDQI